ncbi:MAG TPA: DUF5684 domain-containing protein [Patescibacteria group bacterium]|nr:DUF5684 domain-containing protein [Patescibacteria group bacterium]
MFGQTYTTTTTTNTGSKTFWITYGIVLGLIALLMIISMWKIFVKAGKPGWAAIVPIYNTIVLLRMVKRPIWWIILLFIPVVSLIVGLMIYYDLAKVFGRGVGTFLLLIFVPIIGFPMLGFGDATYNTPAQ